MDAETPKDNLPGFWSLVSTDKSVERGDGRFEMSILRRGHRREFRT
jgi:hypothetical protein